MGYAVQTEVFEGPFDLLLHLILRDQVDIYEVSLARIVDSYLGHLDAMEQLDLEITTEFLLIAAILVELKSKRLLPERGDVDLDDELALWEERDLLLARLIECKTFKDAALVLHELSEVAALRYPRTAGPDERFTDLQPDFLAGVTPDDLRRAFIRAATPKPVPTLDLFHVAPVRLSVAEAVAELLEELPIVGRIGFRRLTAGFVERLEIVVRFLAVLEMTKQGLVDIEQGERFGDIEIVWVGHEGLAASPEMALAAVDTYEG